MERTKIRTHPERSLVEEAPAILAEGLVAEVGFVVDGQPFVIPMTYHYDSDTPRQLYLHGAHVSRLVQYLASGGPVCVTVTLLDGLVYSRTALYHSVNYRSVVCFCRTGATPDSAAQERLLEGMIARYFAGRTAGRDYEPIPAEHLEATGFIALTIEDWSAKVRRGGPKGPRDADENALGTAGVRAIGYRLSAISYS
jgi:nitroimidazol reductase NimA-like FMN-containing flavoprotein (pyridoxamine 5'-phosphate oxidase superfamily)